MDKTVFPGSLEYVRIKKRASAAGKMFFAVYGILVGLVFIATLGVALAPLAHRLIHKFHLDEIDG